VKNKSLTVFLLGLCLSNLVLAAEQGGKNKKSGSRGCGHNPAETEDAMLDRLARENASVMRSEKAKKKAEAATQAALIKVASKTEILDAIDNFLQNANPNTCTVTKTGTVLADSKKCSKRELDSILKDAIQFNLCAIESLMHLAVEYKMKVSKTFSVQQNFAALYSAAAMRPQPILTTPYSVHKYLSDDDLTNPMTCDERFLRLIDALQGDNYFFYAQDIEEGRVTEAPDGTIITPLNKDKIMADLYFQELQKNDSTWHAHTKYYLANIIFKNSLRVHPDGKTNISTKFNQATVAAALYFQCDEFANLANCLDFLNIHPDGTTDISTLDKKYTEMGRLYYMALTSERVNCQIRDEINYTLGARIIARQIKIDPETKEVIANRPQIAAKYWHRSKLPLARECFARAVLLGEITEHLDGSGPIQDPELTCYQILTDIESTNVQRNICLWMLIAKHSKNEYKDKKLNNKDDRFKAIQKDFKELSQDDQDRSRTQFALGIAYSNLGFYTEALPYLKSALEAGYKVIPYVELCRTTLELAQSDTDFAEEQRQILPADEVEAQVKAPHPDLQLTEEQMRLQLADAERERQQKSEETARLVALKKAGKEQMKEVLKRRCEEARITLKNTTPSFKIPVTRVDISPAVQVQKDSMEAILPGKTDAIIQELMDSGCPRQAKSLGRNSVISQKFRTGNQLLIEVKMNEKHRLFYTRDENGIVTIHQIGEHT